MKKYLCCFIALIPICSLAQVHSIRITNNSQVIFRDYVAEIPWSLVTKTWPGIDTTNFRVIDPVTKKEMIFQLEYHGQKDIRNLLVQVTILPVSSFTIDLSTGKHAVFQPKTYCRYVPERKDDFAWENDKIAFRMYGKALESTNENAYGLDVWVKRTDQLVLDKRYKLDDYHKDHGDGLDAYDVGYTLGAGNVMPFKDDSIWYSQNYHRWAILDNGPLRSTFQLSYDNWNVAGESMSVVKTIQLDAGLQLNKITAVYKYAGNKSISLVIGLTKRKQPGILLLNEAKGVMGYWEPASKTDGTTAVGTICMSPVSSIQVTDRQTLMHTESNENGELVYYTGAAWDKANWITNSEDWFFYLNLFKQELQKPLQVSVP